MKKTIYLIIVLVMLTFGVRLVIAFNTYVISSDGPFYLKVGQYFAQGDYKSALLKQTFHPLYPFLIAIAYKFIGAWEWAGMLVSIILSCFAIMPIYFITRRYFTETIAIIACLLYAFQPQGAQLSASIFTTGTFIGILLITLWVTIIALEKDSYLYFMLSGLLSFIMYLLRLDGIVFLALTLIAILINSRMVQGNSIRHTILKIVALLIPWLLLIPNLFIVKSLTGVFGLTGKVSAETLTDMEITKSFYGLYQFIVEFIKGANPILFILFIVGVVLYFKKGRKTFRQTFFIWIVFVGFIIAFSVYAFTEGRMSKRYTVPLFLMMLPWTSAGLYYISDKISSRHTFKIVYGMTILILVGLSFFTFKAVGKDKLIEKTTGELLNKYHSRYGIASKIPSIITTSSRIAYYGGGEAVMPEELGKDYDKLADIILKQGVDYLVLDGRIARKTPFLENEILQCINNQLSIELISPYFEVDGSKNVNSYRTYRFFITQINK
ncbi:MAG: glycosyltransferase family 39 protein [Planctomycetota bacterium]